MKKRDFIKGQRLLIQEERLARQILFGIPMSLYKRDRAIKDILEALKAEREKADKKATERTARICAKICANRDTAEGARVAILKEFSL